VNGSWISLDLRGGISCSMAMFPPWDSAMHEEHATAQLKGKRHARNLFRTGEKLDAEE
jgi:hypothetical protein